MLIPATMWEKERERLTAELGLPGSTDAFVTGLHGTLQRSLHSLAQAVNDGTIFVENDRLRIPRLPTDPEPAEVKALRNELFEVIGPVQLPDLLVQVDRCGSHGFCWAAAHTASANSTHCIARCWHRGADLSAAAVARVVEGISADSIGWFMRKLEEDGRLRQASDTVVTYLPIPRHWGEGLFAASDMMSLGGDASPVERTP